jgi:hypothetical protein
MPAKLGSAKPNSQYGHIKESLRKQGKSDALAEQLAAQTVDRRRSPRDAALPQDGPGSNTPSGHRAGTPRRKR